MIIIAAPFVRFVIPPSKGISGIPSRTEQDYGRFFITLWIYLSKSIPTRYGRIIIYTREGIRVALQHCVGFCDEMTGAVVDGHFEPSEEIEPDERVDAP